MNNIEDVNLHIANERIALLHHPLYARIKDINHLRKFVEGHVYAVWDFMSLLKALQVRLTCTAVPWYASPYPNIRYLVNEIVLAEESDEYVDGRRLSHYEMYLEAMKLLGAETSAIEDFVGRLQGGQDLHTGIDNLAVDVRIKDFLRFTFDTISKGMDHEIAAAFTFGREDLIPDMFTSIITEVQQQFPAVDIAPLHYYFQRHIELDGDEHGPLAMQMIVELTGDDQQKWDDVKRVAKSALQKRIALWDAIADSLED